MKSLKKILRFTIFSPFMLFFIPVHWIAGDDAATRRQWAFIKNGCDENGDVIE